MSATLSPTLRTKDMDRIFTEVPCPENLGLQKPGQLRLFHLLIRDSEFHHADLEKWLYRNLSRYVFSRAQMEQFRQDDDLEAAIAQAINTMKQNGVIDEKGMGNELGEMLIYAFLEGKLAAPKLMSRVELSTDFSKYKSVCESIHLLSKSGDKGLPFHQMVFGASGIVGDIRDAVDNAFAAIMRIKHHAIQEIHMVEKTAFNLSFDKADIDFLKDILIPKPNAQSNYNTAFGVFLGYSIGVSRALHPEVDYQKRVTRKMLIDIQHHARYIADKINENDLTAHSFYIYILPFMDAETNKNEIMEHVIKGAINL